MSCHFYSKRIGTNREIDLNFRVKLVFDHMFSITSDFLRMIKEKSLRSKLKTYYTFDRYVSSEGILFECR